jgi:hypothetical protein
MTVDSSSMSFGTRSEDGLGIRAAPVAASADVALELTAAVIAIRNNEPVVLVVDERPRSDAADTLPSGRFVPGTHTSLELGLREHVRQCTGLELGYVEQLYTFGNGTGEGGVADAEPRTISIAYLALMLGAVEPPRGTCAWRSVYDYFPWEDWRNQRPDVLSREIEPRLKAWAEANTLNENGITSLLDLRERASIAFGTDRARWDDERVLERFELMCEAGLAPGVRHEPHNGGAGGNGALGRAMLFDHCRIVAAAIGRLRGKIRYRPVVFELMEPEFTLYDLQRTVEAILGPHLHKQNFRRLVESVGLVEPTGEIRTHTGGRPARLYRFRREVLLERPAPGVRVKAVARG